MFRPLAPGALACLVLAARAAAAPMIPSPIQFKVEADTLAIEYHASGIERSGHALFVAIDDDPLGGSAVVPYGKGAEGSTVFLPFRAHRIYVAQVIEGGVAKSMRLWKQTQWSTRLDVKPEFVATTTPGVVRLAVRLAELGNASPLTVAVWAKDLNANDGWGAMLPSPHTTAGTNDRVVRTRFSVDRASGAVAVKPRLQAAAERVRIYQLLPRLFGNTNETRQANGTLAENGVGKFRDINGAALAGIRELGFTHVWLTGVLRQATSTAHADLPADDPDLLKGLAGSPYAIKDCFDVCPDYAAEPAERLAEFRALLARVRAAGLRAIIDFVPNHVARSYASSVKPELSFGAKDDRRKFFDPRNNFFWLQADSPGGGPPLRLPTVENGQFISPTCRVLGKGDGLFDAEREHGRVTGNNVASWRPGRHDWYETVKLNYGFDFTTGTRAYPHGAHADLPVPDTWAKMDAVLAYWQALGVDGFRCDMAHMVPPEFWNWAIARARMRQAEVFFVGEAYDNDPMKVPGGDPLLASLGGGRGNVMFDLLNAGFNAVYDDPSYKKLKAIYDGSGWANDLDAALGHEFIFQNSLRYAENHDEVRLAGRGQWGGVGMNVGRAVSAILFGLSRGPVLLYSGQEVGEPADGAEGFGGDDARTTIFDYWSMPALAKWVNGHRYDGGRLSAEQRALREFYARLLKLAGEPAFRDGEFFGLNSANVQNARFGRLPGETASGHWFYAFLRSEAASGQRFLVVANLHRDQTLRDVRVLLPPDALAFLALPANATVRLADRLGATPRPAAAQTASALDLGDLPPLSASYFELLPDDG